MVRKEDEDLGNYKPLVLKSYPAKQAKETAEDRYWNRFKSPILTKQIGAVTHINFSPSQPYHLAVSTSTRVIIYDALNRTVRRTYARFKDKAYSGTLRQDGKLLVAGGEDGIVQVFEFDGRTLLRQLSGHKGAVHVALFSPDKTHILTAGDDTTVRFWDLTSGEQVKRLEGHSDYVRSAAVNPENSNIWATGSYDHTCRVWDLSSGEAMFTLNHGAPIEAVTFYPSGAMLVTAGGTEVKIWEVLSTGSEVTCIKNFQKTVTCLHITPIAGPDSEASMRLLAGSLDGHIRIYELDKFTMKHMATYSSPVLSLGLSGDCRTLAVGMADGTLSLKRHLRKRPPGDSDEEELPLPRQKPKLKASNPKYFSRGQTEKPGPGDLVIPSKRRAALKPYDKFLRQFRHREALDAALQINDAVVVTSLMDELATRNALNSTLGARNVQGQILVLDFVNKHISDPKFTRLLVGVATRFLNLYAKKVAKSKSVIRSLRILQQKLHQELGLGSDLQSLTGCLRPILASKSLKAIKSLVQDDSFPTLSD